MAFPPLTESNFIQAVQSGDRRPPFAGRRTRIVATIGPASESPDELKAMAAAGMDVARVSLSHGSIEDSIQRIRQIRAAVPGIAILADLPGPKVRSTPFGQDGAELVDGAAVRLTVAALTPESSASIIGVSLEEGFGSLSVGDTIVFGDGEIALRVTAAGHESIETVVVSGGHVQGKPGVTVPSHALSLPTPTPEDLERIIALVAEDVEAIAVSFVRSPEDMAAVRAAAGDHPCLLVAKIETQEAVDDIDSIVKVADSVMVARGDLGVRLPIEDVPSLQKQIIRSGVRFGRPAITATQMLESMIHARVPTRAEVTDVANAVHDGTSAVMLSAETAVGAHPALVVATIDRIVRRAEQDFDYARWGESLGIQEASGERGSPRRVTAAITGAGWRAAIEEDAAAIVAISATGMTVRAISRFRPSMPIIAITHTDYRASQLHMSWGVASVVVAESRDPKELTALAIEHVVAEGFAQPGDVIVMLSGSHETAVAMTDTVRMIKIP